MCCVFIILSTSTALAHKGCHSRKCDLRVASKNCSQRQPIRCIRYAAMKYRQPVGDALRVARCESTLNPYAVGYAVHHGLFQFLPSTWRSTPYGGRWIYSSRWNALAAMWMWSVGRRGEWQCR